jgi:hypothetical protein
VPFTYRVISRANQPLFYSSKFGNNSSAAFLELAQEFQKDMGRTVGGCEMGKGNGKAPKLITNYCASLHFAGQFMRRVM